MKCQVEGVHIIRYSTVIADTKSHQVMDRVRVDQANKLKHDKKARQWVKRSRWVLLKNRDNLNTQQDSYITEISKVNQDLMTTYVLGAQLKGLWRCEFEPQAKNLVWWAQVNERGIKPLKEFDWLSHHLY